MSDGHQEDFSGYHRWLGISILKRIPTYYELLAISINEDDCEVIRSAAEQRRRFVESKRGEGHDDVVTEILYRINEAEVTLLNSGLRRDYDRQMNLFEKRRKNRQIDPDATHSPNVRVVSGSEEGTVKTFAGITAVVCTAFGIMTWLSFQLPWNKQKLMDAGEITHAQTQTQSQPTAKGNSSTLAMSKVPELPDTFLDNWETLPSDEKSKWSYKNGVLNSGAYGPSLFTKNRFDDFELSLEFKLPGKCNSGIGFRGIEIELVDSELRSKQTPTIASCGAFKGQLAPISCVYRGADKWNNLRIQSSGPMLIVTMNDVVIVDSYRIKQTKSGNDAMDSKIHLLPGSVAGLEFRNVKIASNLDQNVKAKLALQGAWLCTHVDTDGKSLDEKAVKRQDRRVIFKGNSLTLMRTNNGIREEVVGTCDIDAAMGSFEFQRTSSTENRQVTLNGRFEVAGEYLRLSYREDGASDPAPTYLFKRIDPSKTESYIEFQKKRLAGTKWTNSVYDSLEWTEDGRFLYLGNECDWSVLSDRESQVIVNGHQVDTIAFNESFTEFEQLVKGGPATARGYRHGTDERGLIRRIEGHAGAITTIAFSPDGLNAITGGDKVIRCWDLATGTQRWQTDDFTVNVKIVRFFPDGRRVIACAPNRCVIIDAATGKTSVHTGKNDVFAISGDCRLLALRRKGNVGVVYDLEQHREIRKFGNALTNQLGIFSRNESVLFFGVTQLDRLDMSTGKQSVRHIVQPTNSVIGAADFSPKDEFLATGSQKEVFLDRGESMGDRTVRLWNVPSGKLEREFKDHREFINAVAFTREGNRLLSGGGGTFQNPSGSGGSSDRSIRIWDVATGRLQRTFDGHLAAVQSLAVSPDGDYFLSGSADGMLVLWRLPDAKTKKDLEQ